MQQKSIFNFELRAGRVFPEQKKMQKLKHLKMHFCTFMEASRKRQERVKNRCKQNG